MTRRKLYLILTPVALVLLIAAWQALRYWYYHGYSHGTRTGIIRKLSLKGSPLCRWVSGEMAIVGTQPGQQPELWEFTIDQSGLDSPIAKKLYDAQRQVKPVTLSYRQDRGKWWACASTEYYVINVE